MSLKKFGTKTFSVYWKYYFRIWLQHILSRVGAFYFSGRRLTIEPLQ